MTEEEKKQVDLIEKDRRIREHELLILLALLFGTATRHAVSAVRLGHDPALAARNVVVGNRALELPGLAQPAAKLLSVTYIDGMRRASRMAGIAPGPRTPEMPTELLDAQAAVAERVAEGMAQTLVTKINDAVGESIQAGLGTKKIARAVRQAVVDGGYGADNPYLLKTVAERGIVDAHGAGMWNNWHDPQVADKLVGFKHVTVMDEGTTDICKCRNGFMRPKDDEYWETSWPALHWGCRSVILPLFKDHEWTLARPAIPPAPGFGWAMSPLRNVSA
jgi:SPP1 gp7 family putative phage head morphogenesis protein